ncbi:hypothetical protein U1Q18_003293 [Sarracenia purpurea var. burkii]
MEDEDSLELSPGRSRAVRDGGGRAPLRGGRGGRGMSWAQVVKEGAADDCPDRDLQKSAIWEKPAQGVGKVAEPVVKDKEPDNQGPTSMDLVTLEAPVEPPAMEVRQDIFRKANPDSVSESGSDVEVLQLESFPPLSNSVTSLRPTEPPDGKSSNSKNKKKR